MWRVHSDAKVLFVDGAALLSRVFESWSEYENVSRLVLLDDSLDAAKILESLRAAGKKSPRSRRSSAASSPWSKAQSIGASRDHEDPLAFQRTHGRGLARSAGTDALHERHLRESEGRSAHASQRRDQRTTTGSSRTRRSSSRTRSICSGCR